MNEEIWKDIPNYEGKYQASTLGRIKSLKDNHGNDIEKMLSPIKDKKGYLRINLWKNGKIKQYMVHRLVIITFMGKPLDNDYYSVNHLDENKTNNKLENLQYCTHKFNTNYGTCIERSTKARSKPVIGINKINGYICEFESTREAERITGIFHSTINDCCKGKLKSAGGYRWFYANSEEVEK